MGAELDATTLHLALKLFHKPSIIFDSPGFPAAALDFDSVRDSTVDDDDDDDDDEEEEEDADEDCTEEFEKAVAPGVLPSPKRRAWTAAETVEMLADSWSPPPVAMLLVTRPCERMT